jgi:hypothetical protein
MTTSPEKPAPLVEVAGQGQFVLSTDEIFAIETARLKAPIAILNLLDRAKIKPAIDKVIGENCLRDTARSHPPQ